MSVRTAIKRARVRRLTQSNATRAGSARSAPFEPANRQGQAAMQTTMSRGLEDAEQLADAGHLVEAAEICEAHIREQGVSARAYYLLGRIRGAAGAESQAADFYRRALYLEPAHYETLVHLASLSEKSGDAERARILQERAKRAAREST
jgi:chemotaxis protein methyltransferase WspC